MTETAPARRRRTPPPTPTPLQQGLILSAKAIEEEVAAVEVTEGSMEEAKASAAPVHTIHMVEDGMTFLGKVWYRARSSRWPKILPVGGPGRQERQQVPILDG